MGCGSSQPPQHGDPQPHYQGHNDQGGGHAGGSINVNGAQIPRELLVQWVEAAHAELVDGRNGEIGRFLDSGQMNDAMMGVLEPIEQQLQGSPDRESALYDLEVRWGIANGPSPGGGGHHIMVGVNVNGVVIPGHLLRKWLKAAKKELVKGKHGKIGEFLESGELNEQIIAVLDPIEEDVKRSGNPKLALKDLKNRWFGHDSSSDDSGW
eukprot:TRINITY_DN68029_c0_g1_i1.p1 TRINITY_DN68029_c0_g1~~TRINITY_DN68029_c0_g1_i1.p1  ORF type:complete len:231 (-),score=33.71 TRINITY_DN68029_c0_g1_i1:188-814(-)